MEKYIKLSDCKHGFLYKIHSRNLNYGVFDKTDGGFIGIREKFGQRYLFKEFHWDTDAPYGTVNPQEEICRIPEEIDINENLIHSMDDLWAKNPETGEIEEVIRRNLEKNELKHGSRMNFEDLWVKNFQRLQDGIYPFTRGNKKLFEFLEQYEGKSAEEKILDNTQTSELEPSRKRIAP